MPCRTETRLVPYTPEQMFALVADIERYPEFLPWCLGARILTREGNVVLADLTVGKGSWLCETFTSQVTFEAPSRIVVAYADGPLKRLHTEWRFTPAPRSMCQTAFTVDFALKSGLVGSLMDAVFDQAFARMLCAFESRARFLYPSST